MTDSDIFARARFCGRRFDGGHLDLDAIPELVAYKRIIIETAKWLFRVDHPDRARVPKGFERSFSLALTGVESGSANAKLLRVDDGSQLPLGAHDCDYFEQARTRVNEIIDRAGQGQKLEGVPLEVLRVLEQLGASLGAEESLEIMPRDASNGARYDRTVRRNISLAITSEYEEVLEIIGVVVAVDRMRRRCSIRLGSGEKQDGRFREDLADPLAHALATKGYCRLQVTATYSQSETMKRLEVEEFEALEFEGPDFEQRLSEIAGFPPGWLAGEGQAVRSAEIDSIRQLLRQLVWDFGFVAPHLYPTARGGVRAEWTAGDSEISLETTSGRDFHLHAVELETDEERERDSADLKDVMRFLRGLVNHDPVVDEVLGDG